MSSDVAVAFAFDFACVTDFPESGKKKKKGNKKPTCMFAQNMHETKHS